MFLSDVDIRKKVKKGSIIIDPFNDVDLQQASYDLHLSNRFLSFVYGSNVCIDPKKDINQIMEEKIVSNDDFLVLHPGEMVLGCTTEIVGVNYDFVAILQGKSSIARLGLIVYTAGLLNTGNMLSLTLELTNIGRLPVKVYAGMPITQIMFAPLSSTAEKPSGDGTSVYDATKMPQASKTFEIM